MTNPQMGPPCKNGKVLGGSNTSEKEGLIIYSTLLHLSRDLSSGADQGEDMLNTPYKDFSKGAVRLSVLILFGVGKLYDLVGKFSGQM